MVALMIINKIKHFFLKKEFGSFGTGSTIGYNVTKLNLRYVHVGKNVCIRDNVRIECYDEYYGSTYNPLLIIEDGAFINSGFSCLVNAKCVVGENALLASNIFITTENHSSNPRLPYKTQSLIAKDVSIGKNCWIGEKCIILPGVSIGDNTIVGAGSVVTKSVPSNCIVVGNPAQVIKKYDFDTEKWVKCNE